MANPRGDSAWSGVGTAWIIISTLIAGILVGWGPGYLVDRVVGTDRVFQAVGMIGGTAAAIYLVYLRYGRGDRGQD